MRVRLDGTRAVVTGASSGIGAELARLLAPRVAHLALVARRVDRLETLAAELTQRHPDLRVSVLPCDLADLDAVKALGARLRTTLGGVDILVNNAGAAHTGYFDQLDWAATEKLITLNAVAPAWLIHHLLPDMLARGTGGILNINSGFGLASLPTFSTYVATKHFMAGLTETLRAETAGTGVVITQAHPGPVDTDLVSGLEKSLLIRPPRFFFISPERCAKACLAAFEQGRAAVVPGLRMRLAMFLLRNAPDVLVRFVQERLARRRLVALADARQTGQDPSR